MIIYIIWVWSVKLCAFFVGFILRQMNICSIYVLNLNLFDYWLVIVLESISPSRMVSPHEVGLAPPKQVLIFLYNLS